MENNYEEAWSKCPSCGAYNGQYGRPLEQHRPRCSHKGPANDYSYNMPNYFQMIKEDDKSYLPMMHAETNLPIALKQVKNLEKEIQRLEWESLEFETKFIEEKEFHRFKEKYPILYNAIVARQNKEKSLTIKKKVQ